MLPTLLLEDNLVRLEESLSPERLAVVLEFATEVVFAFSAVRIQTGPPPNFLAAAWPCLVASMSSDGYYLSIDELLLICQVVRQNVCIFETCMVT